MHCCCAPLTCPSRGQVATDLEVLNGQPYAWPVTVGPAGLTPGCSYIFRVDAVNAVGGCPGLPSKPFALGRSAALLDAPLVSVVPPPEPILCRVRVVLRGLLP